MKPYGQRMFNTLSKPDKFFENAFDFCALLAIKLRAYIRELRKRKIFIKEKGLKSMIKLFDFSRNYRFYYFFNNFKL